MVRREFLRSAVTGLAASATDVNAAQQQTAAIFILEPGTRGSDHGMCSLKNLRMLQRIIAHTIHTFTVKPSIR